MRRMILLLRTRVVRLLVFLFVFAFTFILRAHNYDRVPGPGHLDEQLYAWAGINLVETGTPVSWSTLDYPKRAEVFKGRMSYQGGEPSSSVTLYKPWLDEPPVFSYVVGWFAHYFGADRNGFIPSSYIRFPVVLISTLTSIFVFLVAGLVSGYWLGILAMGIYGIVPIFVFGSRSAMPENLIALFLMVSIYLLLRFRKSPKFSYIAAIPFLAGIAGLAKPTGFFIVPLAAYFVLVKKKDAARNIVYLFLFTLPFVLGYFYYGNHYDPEIFRIITSIQSHRPIGFSALAFFATTPSFATNIFLDSWYVFATVASFYFVLAPPQDERKVISLGFVYWFAVVMLSGGQNDLLSWYRFPLFPLMAIMAAWALKFLLVRADIFATFIGVGLLLGSRRLLVNPFRPDLTPTAVRAITSLAFVPSVLATIKPKRILLVISRTVMILAVVFGVWYNVIFIYNAFELTCESIRCPIVPSTFLSEVHFPFVWRLFVLPEPSIH